MSLTQQSCALFQTPNRVRITHSDNGYVLEVNQKPFYIKGAGVGEVRGKKGENYLLLAKNMGANAVRTWGVDQGDNEYLDQAHRLGLYVDAGIWMNYVIEGQEFSYIHNQEYMLKKEKETLDYVRQYKNHPAILMWNIGNETIHFTKSEEERIAFCHFLEKLIQKVKKEDPRHPVIYASAYDSAFTYLSKYVPSLDIVGVNLYGSVVAMQGSYTRAGLKIPYCLTEFGPYGSWDAEKDSNDMFIEPSDMNKATQYRNTWSLLKSRKNKNIGGFAFHIGETTQDSLTYWNINYGQYKRESFNMIKKMFTGEKILNHAPRKLRLKGIPKTARANELIQAELSASDPEGEVLKYEFKVSTTIVNVLKYYVNEELPVQIKRDGNRAKIQMPKEKGIYRIYGFAIDGDQNISSTSKTIKVE